MEQKTSLTNGIGYEPVFQHFPLYKDILAAKEDAYERPDTEVLRCPGERLNAGEIETDQAGALDQRIKFILQDCLTGRFMRCDSMWSDDMDEALNFLSAPRAVFYGMKELKAEFHLLQIGHAGIMATSTINPGLLRWTKAPRAAHVAEEVKVARKLPARLVPEVLPKPVLTLKTRMALHKFTP
ncbi:MAG TPA: hypothetical protein VK742_17480 [Candidatus Sulfotelmatobacter sp.]|jgi:hypothetical protein|nr:hypothetical protein [Candidatus Sulfotelmatobacter sp.]